MNYIIRAATAKDELTVWEMLRYASHEPSIESVRKQPYLARYAIDWGRVGDLGCIAQNELHIGMSWLRLWQEADKGYGYVSDTIPELAIAVLPDYRGQGVGTDLLVRILEMAKARFSAVSLSVRADNPVVRLYERTGFIKVSGSEIINRSVVSYNMLKEFK